MMLRRCWPDRGRFTSLSKAVGRVVRKEVDERAEISITLHRMNDYFCIFFPETSVVEAHDPGNKCDVGDVVLLHKLEEPRRYVETHKVAEIVHKVGDVIDPMTGRKVEGHEFCAGAPLTEERKTELKKNLEKRELFFRYRYEFDEDIVNWESRNTKQG